MEWKSEGIQALSNPAKTCLDMPRQETEQSKADMISSIEIYSHVLFLSHFIFKFSAKLLYQEG